MSLRPEANVPAVPHEDAAVVALVERARAGSREDFAALVERFQAPLYGFLVLRAASAEDAEELCQDAFVRAWQRLALYDARWRFSTWLFTLARRLAASRYRRARREEHAPVALEAARSERDGPERLASRCEESANLWALAARTLSREQRSALWLRYAEDLSPEAIGTVLSKRTATVRVILFRARERLARALAERSSTEVRAEDRPAPPRSVRYTAASTEVEA